MGVEPAPPWEYAALPRGTVAEGNVVSYSAPCSVHRRAGLRMATDGGDFSVLSSHEIIVFEGELGWSGLAARETGVVASTFGHAEPERALQALRTRAKPRDSTAARIPLVRQGADRWYVSGTSGQWQSSGRLADLARRLIAFMAGVPADFHEVPLDLDGFTPFQRVVTSACRQVEWGELRTYSWLARVVGHPRAARAVGGVMARNPLPLIVPCHRIIGAAGELTGFSAPHGIRMKARLLQREKLVSQIRSGHADWCTGASAWQPPATTSVRGSSS